MRQPNNRETNDIIRKFMVVNGKFLRVNGKFPIQASPEQITKPTYSTISKTYTGSVLDNGYHTPSRGVTMTGNNSGTNAGQYVATYSVQEGFEWSDGTTDSVSITLTIEKANNASYILNVDNLVYNGSDIQFVPIYSGCVLGGDYVAAIPGTYNFNITPDSNHTWPEGGSEAKNFQAIINKRPITITAGSTTKMYDGTPLEYNNATVTSGSVVEGEHFILGANGSITNAGTTQNVPYINFLPVSHENYYSVTTVNGILKVERANTATAWAMNRTYNGSSQVGIIGEHITLSGNYERIDAGTYTGKAEPESNYAWSDGSYAPRLIQWIMNKATGSVTIAPSARSLVYNGSSQSLVNPGSGTGTMYYSLSSTSGFTTSIPVGTNAGSYIVYYYAAESNNYNQSATGSVSVGISRLNTATASSSDQTYTGGTKVGVSGSYVNWSGTTSAINGGSYTAYATPDSNHSWSNGGTEQRAFSWNLYYTWYKYNTVATPSKYAYTTESVNDLYLSWDDSDKQVIGYEYFLKFNESKGKFLFSETTPSSYYYQYYEDNPYFMYSSGYLEESNICYLAFPSSNVTNHKAFINGYKYTAYISEYTYSKGTTSYGLVYSTSSSAYPQNGTPDNTYWYVKNW